MRICHICHGRLPMPPIAYGAVETVVTDYGHHCRSYGHEFLAINKYKPQEAVFMANGFQPDIAHLHDESKIDWLHQINARIKIVTTHDPLFFSKPNPFIDRFKNGDFFIQCLSSEQKDGFVKNGIPENRMFILRNGARSDLIRFNNTPRYPHTALCLGIVSERKGQKMLADIKCVDFVGPISEYDTISEVSKKHPRYKGEWTRQQVHEHLGDYGALVLPSWNEAAPLVVVEALMAGRPVIVSSAASANLPDLPFILKVSKQTITNAFLFRMMIEEFLSCKRDYRKIRDFAEKYFDWSIIVKQYLRELSSAS